MRSYVFISPDLEAIKRFSCSTQLSMKAILLIGVKMFFYILTFSSMLIFIRMMNTTYESLKARGLYFSVL